MFSGLDEALAYVSSTPWTGAKLDLSRVRRLCALLSDPQDSLRCVHIAGTNGKGSTAAMLASVLKCAGVRFGFYVSPPLHSFNERIQVDGRWIADAEVVSLAWEIKQAAEKMPDPPTEFEKITAMAFMHFARSGCELAVLEVGMGGRLDATNVIPPPLAAVITTIGLDHTEFLGKSKALIAAEKCGIIKRGSVRVIAHPQEAEVEGVIDAKCCEESVPLRKVAQKDIASQGIGIGGQAFMYGGESYSLSLLGRHQLQNAAAVIETVGALRECGYRIGDGHLRDGLLKAKWPARFEILQKEPLFILDVAHNPSGVGTVIDTMCDIAAEKTAVFLIGVLMDKDYAKMLCKLAPRASEIVAVPTAGPRGLPAHEIARAASAIGLRAAAYGSVEEGVRASIAAAAETAESGVACALGSISIANEVRRCFR